MNARRRGVAGQSETFRATASRPRTDPRGLDVAVLIKQVPRFEMMELSSEGRLRRDAAEAEINPYCRRALSKGIELAREAAGRCTVLSLGPPRASEALREALACGADRAVLVSDAAFAGSDTLATARALAVVLEREGPFDLVLTGRNSVDADTGQVPPQLAELLGVAFLAGARRLTLEQRALVVECEGDDGWSVAKLGLPAVISCAERLCAAAKAPREQWAPADTPRLERVGAAELGSGPWGASASPTRVGVVRRSGTDRARRVLDQGPLPERVSEAVAGIAELVLTAPLPARAERAVPDSSGAGPGGIVVLAEPAGNRMTRELLGRAAVMASELGTGVSVVSGPPGSVELSLGQWGADELLQVPEAYLAEDVAAALAQWCAFSRPYVVLAPGTLWGREIAARIAARLGAGLVGDAVALEIERESRRLTAWKPALGGEYLVAITYGSPLQLATVRPGVLALLRPRAEGRLLRTDLAAPSGPSGRISQISSVREDALERLSSAPVVIGVGMGVDPQEYSLLEPLSSLLGAELAATRKVTDRRYLARSRQVGLTGRSISPALYIALGLKGGPMHMVGVRSAGTVLAVNWDRSAAVFEASDIGIVGDWHDVVPLLVEELSRALSCLPWPAGIPRARGMPQPVVSGTSGSDGAPGA